MIKKYTDKNQVENVVLYISDSVRWDALPESIAERGVSARTITPSTFTGSSIPSIITSMYPPDHQVWNFSSKLGWKPYISDLDLEFGVDVNEVWGKDYENDKKPTLNLLNIDRNTPFDPSKSSFFHIIHDHGGHAPYGREINSFKSSEDFFKGNKNDASEITRLYTKGVNKSSDRFIEIYNNLLMKNKLEKTLLIYTSDHGELLGEVGGIYGHSNPMVPKLVNVPTVFCGAGLSRGLEVRQLISSIDIVPTALAALEENIPSSMNGMNLWNKNIQRKEPIFSDVWKPSRFDNIHYKASSIWSETGGIVYNHSSKLSRLVFSFGHHYHHAPYASLMRRNGFQGFMELLECYNPTLIEYGDYSEPYNAKRLKDREFSTGEANRNKVNKELLRDLGYVE